MHIVYFVLILVPLTSTLVKTKRGYHEEVGIPMAYRIKKNEEKLLADEESGDISRISSGFSAYVTDHPYFAGLLIDLVNTNNRSVCGSSLLTPNRLVTAAHCWFDGKQQAWQFNVIFATTNLYYNDGIRVATSKVIPHPEFDLKNHNDLAMIYLPVDMTFSDLIQPISLPYGDELANDFVGYTAIAAGYGKVFESQETSPVVNHVELQIISVEDCNSFFLEGTVWYSHICTSGNGGVGICPGDSGGPLVTKLNGRLVLIGISSFVAKEQCGFGFPSAFTRVTSFDNFIRSHL